MLVGRVRECQGMLRSALASARLIKDDDERGITRYCLTLVLPPPHADNLAECLFGLKRRNLRTYPKFMPARLCPVVGT